MDKNRGQLTGGVYINDKKVVTLNVPTGTAWKNKWQLEHLYLKINIKYL